MTRDLFYLKRNESLLKTEPILIFVLCAFWTILDIQSGDSMYFVKTGALFGVLAMAFTSLLLMLVHRYVRNVLNRDNIQDEKTQQALRLLKTATILMYISMIIAAAMVCAANNYAISISGAGFTFQTISLSSTLLFIVSITPLPDKRDGFILLAVTILSLMIPAYMPGNDCYAFLPEIILRIAVTVAYVVLYIQTEKNFVLEQTIKTGNVKLMAMLVNLIELRSLESGKHVNIVKAYTGIMLEKLMQRYPEYELTPAMIEAISNASATHDIGKILIPDNILLKPEALTDDEFEIMKTHTSKGREILMNVPEELVDANFLKYSLDICMYHHEKYDGKGYPCGLKGEEIPIWAQVVSIVDCYEALTSERCYKEAYSHQTAVKMILAGECGQFSDKIIDCFLASAEEFREFK